jgi:SAM-dependent methyltransferase
LERQDLDGFADAYKESFRFHDENIQMLSWYAERLVQAVQRAGARSLLSLGIGHSVVSKAILEKLLSRLEEYVIVEGSPASIARFEAETPHPKKLRLVNALFEEFERPEPFDFIEMGFILEHVDDPEVVLRRFWSALRPGGGLVVVVPNARSLHRLFGKAAGLLEDLYRLSPEDLQLGHKRYFDYDSICSLVARAGFRIERAEGVFLKCLTTGQLQKLRLSPEVLRSFFDVGIQHPQIANAIYLEATR